VDRWIDSHAKSTERGRGERESERVQSARERESAERERERERMGMRGTVWEPKARQGEARAWRWGRLAFPLPRSPSLFEFARVLDF
jgi:hypothetical protein